MLATLVAVASLAQAASHQGAAAAPPAQRVQYQPHRGGPGLDGGRFQGGCYFIPHSGRWLRKGCAFNDGRGVVFRNELDGLDYALVNTPQGRRWMSAPALQQYRMGQARRQQEFYDRNYRIPAERERARERERAQQQERLRRTNPEAARRWDEIYGHMRDADQRQKEIWLR